MRAPCCLCVCICIPPPTIIARKRLNKHVPIAMNTHTTIEKLLDVLFSMQSISHQRKVCVSMGLPMCTSPIIPRQQPGKQVPTATKHIQQYCWMNHFLCGPCHMKGKWVVVVFFFYFIIIR
jgi:hypothetical protein